jgi:pimeloyl-ACP methyl ester carboxylesterase
MDIPHFNLDGGGPPLHFLHANGYPPACYNPLFELLHSKYHVFGMLLRPLWEGSRFDGLKDWEPFTDDLLRFLANNGPDPVIGIGHSIGGIVTLRAALRNPVRFHALVLLDPVLFPPYFIRMWNLARLLGIGYRVHPKIRGALKRRREFDDPDLVFRGYRSRDVFRYLSDDQLRAYIQGIIKPKAGGGYELAYAPEWESHIYYSGVWRDMDLWRGLKQLNVPALIIRGAETDTFLESAATLVKRKQPRIRIETVARSTHLVPLERPQEVFDILESFLKEIQ